MKKDTYNGWTNYATWRINLEIFDGLDPMEFWGIDAKDIAPEFLEAYAEAIVSETAPGGLALNYALSFMAEVDWHEIADHMREDYA